MEENYTEVFTSEISISNSKTRDSQDKIIKGENVDLLCLIISFESFSQADNELIPLDTRDPDFKRILREELNAFE